MENRSVEKTIYFRSLDATKHVCFLPKDLILFYSWWFQPTHLKNMRTSKWESSPSRVENKRYLNHHLVFCSPIWFWKPRSASSWVVAVGRIPIKHGQFFWKKMEKAGGFWSIGLWPPKKNTGPFPVNPYEPRKKWRVRVAYQGSL